MPTSEPVLYDTDDVSTITIRRGSLSPAQERCFAAISDLQDSFSRAGDVEETLVLQIVQERFCVHWGARFVAQQTPRRPS